MKDPADTVTLELPILGIVALPDWLADAIRKCPIEASALDLRMIELQCVPERASTSIFIAAYDRMLTAREALYDAWIAGELDAWPDTDE